MLEGDGVKRVTSFKAKNFLNYINNISIVKEPSGRAVFF